MHSQAGSSPRVGGRQPSRVAARAITVAVFAIATLGPLSGCVFAWGIRLSRYADPVDAVIEYRADVKNERDVKLAAKAKPEVVPIPFSIAETLPVYWKWGDRFVPPKQYLPDREFQVIGHIYAEAGFALQGFNFAFIESEFRRAAATIGGDAVIDAYRGPYFGPTPINSFGAYVVRWRSSPSSMPASTP